MTYQGQRSDPLFIDLLPGSEIELLLLAEIRRSFLDPTFTTTWKPALVQLVGNFHRTKLFNEKIGLLNEIAKSKGALNEHFGFLVCNNYINLRKVCQYGLQTREDAHYQPLGPTFSGVHVCKHADACMRYTWMKNSELSFMRILIVKYVLGRYRKVFPNRQNTQTSAPAPTADCDSHTSQLSPNPMDVTHLQFDKAQVYLFEVNLDGTFNSAPRHVLPYAVVTLTADGFLPPTPQQNEDWLSPEQVEEFKFSPSVAGVNPSGFYQGIVPPWFSNKAAICGAAGAGGRAVRVGSVPGTTLDPRDLSLPLNAPNPRFIGLNPGDNIYTAFGLGVSGEGSVVGGIRAPGILGSQPSSYSATTTVSSAPNWSTVGGAAAGAPPPSVPAAAPYSSSFFNYAMGQVTQDQRRTASQAHFRQQQHQYQQQHHQQPAQPQNKRTYSNQLTRGQSLYRATPGVSSGGANTTTTTAEDDGNESLPAAAVTSPALKRPKPSASGPLE